MIALLLSAALAKSWCADPLIAHEWGVTVLTANSEQPVSPELPDYFHRPGDPFAIASAPVRTLPADSGIRALPVVHLYASGPIDSPIPFAMEVGFRDGEASAWYPTVDALIPGNATRSPGALLQRATLVDARSQLTPLEPRPDLGSDPTRQLHWTALQLSPAAPTAPVSTSHSWVNRARAIPHALWVQQGVEAERFLFYEADTVEDSAVELSRTKQGWTLRNTSSHSVHDIVLIADGTQWTLPELAPGARVSPTPHPLDSTSLERTLRTRWTTASPFSPERDWEGCTMDRDPMIPVEQATDHRLFPDEVDLLWEVWGERIVADQPHLLYREEPAALDEAMPASLYTDMFHELHWSRLGLVLVDGLEGT